VNPVGVGDTAETYRDFGDRQAAGSSATFAEWALGVCDDPDVLALVDDLPPGKRQPNLVFAAARWHGASGSYRDLRRVLVEQWSAVRATVLARATQTNEVGRCATLLPALALVPGRLALIEVGASAGLCLLPDRYSYRFSDGTSLDPVSGRSPVVVECEVHGDPPLPVRLPEVSWRVGVDLNPLDVRDDDQMRWLRTLVWPEHDDRRSRLAAAVEVARAEPPRLVRGDLLEELPGLVAAAPEGTTPVVFHSAVLAYPSEDDRRRFVDLVTSLPCVWVSNEGPAVVPGIRDVPAPEPGRPRWGAPFVLAVDGRAVAWTEGHGRAVDWFGSHRRHGTGG
jgi:hypothetical protein